MIKGTIRRIKFMSDRIRIHTNPAGDANQARCGLAMAMAIDQVCFERGTHAGRVLWYRLSADQARFVQYTDFDPYITDMSMQAVAQWLWDHVVFDANGTIIAIHDHGKILMGLEGHEYEIEMFGRVRRRKEHKASRHNHL